MSRDRRANESRTGVTQTPDTALSSGQRQIVWIIWLTYGAFYFCRANMSAAVPGLKADVADGGLGLGAAAVGLILGTSKLAYAFGQLINGQLAERLSPRRMLAIGMFLSAGLNVAFGFGTAFYFLLFIWACNGYCQGLGWTPCMRVAANWIPSRCRGRAIGIIGTGYQITAAATFFLAGFSVSRLGWRGAFYIPPIVLACAGVFMLAFLRESPEPLRGAREREQAHPPRARGGYLENIAATLTNPAIWLLGISLGLLNACRYGFMDWGIAHLTDIHAVEEGAAGLQKDVLRQAVKYLFLPLGGVLGAFYAGWVTDRFFGGRRAPVICGLLVLLGLLTLTYDQVARTSYYGTIGLLILIGVAIFGPQVLLVGTAPADLARRGTAAAAAGFVNFMGYVGAFSGDWVTGKALETYDWQWTVKIWACWAFAAAIFAAFLWNATARKHE